MSEQHKALRMADALDEHDWRGAAAELRRLHEVNADLLAALVSIVNSAKANNAAILYPLLDDARAARNFKTKKEVDNPHNL